MSRASELHIRHGRELVAKVDDQGLSYAEQWLERDHAFALSHSLPLQAKPHTPEAAWRWLINLLPEGEARKRITARLKISTDNDLALLRALGRDCAGAITVSEADADSRELELEPAEWVPYRPLAQSTLLDMTQSPGVVASLIGDEVRLSLAGAQDKIPVRVLDSGQLALPLDGAPSTHLLKCPNRDFAHLVDNEYLCLELARAVGLPVVEARPLLLEGRALLLIDRFDREPPIEPKLPTPTSDRDQVVYAPQLARIHQEDFAQALGHPHYEKYEAEGGPSFAGCMALVRSSARKPIAEIGPLMRWLVYCLIIGNRDNHAKNLARVRKGRYWELAPFYDLVCTTAYPRLTAKLAMRIGDTDDANALSRANWTAQAKRMKIGARLLFTIIEELCDAVEDRLPATLEAVGDALERREQLGGFRRAIHKGLRLARRSIDQ